jgi:hypothetical protein
MGNTLLDGSPTAARFGSSVLQLNLTSSRYDSETGAASDQVGSLMASGSVVRLFASGSDMETNSVQAGLTGSLYFLKPQDGDPAAQKPARILGHNIDESISGAWTFANLTASAGAVIHSLRVADGTDLDGTLNVDGATTLNGAVTLGNATGDDITVSGLLASDIIAKTDNNVDLGSASKRFAEGHINVLHADSLGQALNANSQNITNVGTFEVDGGATFNGAVTLGDASGDDLTINGRFVGNMVPKTAGAVELGTSALPFGGIYAGSVSASYIAVDHLDVNTINSVTKTVNTLEVSDKYIVLASGSTGGAVNGAGIAFGGHGSHDGTEGPENAECVMAWDSTLNGIVLSGSTPAAAVALSASGQVRGLGFSATTSVAAGTTVTAGSNIQGNGTLSLNNGTNTISAAEINVLDAVTAGTAAASKAVVLDANKDIGTIRNLTIDGTFSDGNYTFDTSGNVTGLGTVGCGAITSTGNFSADGTITGDTSLTLDSTTITTAEIGVLDSVTAGTAAASKAVVLDASKNIATIGTIGCGAITSTGASSVGSLAAAGALTVGANTDGHDVKFFGNADSAYMLWDESADDLILAGAAGLIVPDGQFTLGSTAVSSTAAELNLLDGSVVGRVVASKAAVYSSSGSLGASAISGIDLGAGIGLSLDFSTCGTGTGKIMLKDNLAAALEVQQGVGGSAVSYLKFVSTNSSESVDVGVDLNLAEGASVTADGFLLNSDETLKKDIKTLDNALGKVMAMRGVTYQFKSRPEKQEVGFLAQEMKNSVPEVVGVTHQGTLAIDYAKLTSVLVEAVKSQQEQIEELRQALLKK